MRDAQWKSIVKTLQLQNAGLTAMIMEPVISAVANAFASMASLVQIVKELELHEASNGFYGGFMK